MNEAVMNTFVQRDISKHKAAQKLMFYPEIDTRTAAQIKERTQMSTIFAIHVYTHSSSKFNSVEQRPTVNKSQIWSVSGDAPRI